MKWERGRRSTNIEDRRGQSVQRGGMIGGGGLGTLAISLLRALLGGDLSDVLQPSAQAPVATESAPRPAAEDELATF